MEIATRNAEGSIQTIETRALNHKELLFTSDREFFGLSNWIKWMLWFGWFGIRWQMVACLAKQKWRKHLIQPTRLIKWNVDRLFHFTHIQRRWKNTQFAMMFVADGSSCCCFFLIGKYLEMNTCASFKNGTYFEGVEHIVTMHRMLTGDGCNFRLLLIHVNVHFSVVISYSIR